MYAHVNWPSPRGVKKKNNQKQPILYGIRIRKIYIIGQEERGGGDSEEGG